MAIAILLAIATACDAGPGRRSAAGLGADSISLAPRQTRELIFVGRRQGDPLAASFAFRTVDGAATRAREIRGWLGHGNRWETFLDERWTSGRSGSAWTVVPHGALRVAAGGAGEVEALWFRRSGRSLRLGLDGALAQWNRGGTARVHLYSGSLSVGGETTRGTVVELLHLRRPREDQPGLVQHLLLTSGDSLTLYVAPAASGASGSGAIAWIHSSTGIREWSDVRLVPRGGRPLPEARREIPRGWGLVIPEAGIRGEVRPLGFAAEIGRERAGLRGVEARYTVTGWIEWGGRRRTVSGVARYAID
jgi:hypothetical protein